MVGESDPQTGLYRNMTKDPGHKERYGSTIVGLAAQCRWFQSSRLHRDFSTNASQPQAARPPTPDIGRCTGSGGAGFLSESHTAAGVCSFVVAERTSVRPMRHVEEGNNADQFMILQLCLSKPLTTRTK